MSQISEHEITIGIDLGTTNSCVASYYNESVSILENKQTGMRTTPSIVTFTNEDRIIGKPPKITENTVMEAKRLIGRKFDDEHVQNDMKKWPFRVINDNNKPKIKVAYKGKDEIMIPEQISAMVLEKMKDCAELHLNQKVSKAVITVPAYFNDAQRQATKDAAQIAGLDVLRIINEPTAAAIAYGYDKVIYKKTNVLIFDLGGGTFDVSIMEIDQGQFKVLAIGGDTHLGGADFDNNLVNHFVDLYKTKHGKDITTEKKAMQRLRAQCEQAKHALSESSEATLEIDSFFDGEDFNEKLSLDLFNEINARLFEETINVVRMTLADARLDKADILDIILVGGITINLFVFWNE